VRPSSPKPKRSREKKKEPKKSKEEGRQRQPVGGPRVKHVCRSASVALGQPIATFPEKSPTPEEAVAADAPPVEPTIVPTKPPPPVEAKPSKPLKPQAVVSYVPPGRHKKAAAAPAENLISMDFWEIYDPDEICEMGFSLIGSEPFSVRALCFLCGSAGQEKVRSVSCFSQDSGTCRMSTPSLFAKWRRVTGP